MTDTTPPPGTSFLPCQLNPEQWFDRRNHADALAGCLGCPARRWCALEALQSRASWGLWAGIWIDERHEDAAPYLQAVASDDSGQRSEAGAALFETASAPLPMPLRRPAGWYPPRSVSAAVLARSSGHCEVLGEGCRYSYNRPVSRLADTPSDKSSTPPSLFAACDWCADMVAGLDPKLAAQFGYVVNGHRDPARVPFYWRQSRWVLLDRDGWLTEATDDAQTA